jgi:hypothetical protein
MERSEADGSIRLETARRAAEALGATLTYAIVPDTPLEEQVNRRARELAERDVEAAQQTMLLEAQLGGSADREELVEELAGRFRDSPRLWRE